MTEYNTWKDDENGTKALKLGNNIAEIIENKISKILGNEDIPWGYEIRLMVKNQSHLVSKFNKDFNISNIDIKGTNEYKVVKRIISNVKYFLKQGEIE